MIPKIEQALNSDIFLPETVVQSIVENIFPNHSISILDSRQGLQNQYIEVMSEENNSLLHIRIFKGDQAIQRAMNEIVAYKTLNQENIPLPTVIDANTNGHRFGFPYIVLSQIPGETMESLLPKIGAAERNLLAYKLGVSLGKIHSYPFEKHSDNLVNPPLTDNNWNEFLTSRILRNIDWATDNKLISSTTAKQFYKYTYSMLHLIPHSITPVLLHGDFHPGNVHCTFQHEKWEISGIYDFENSGTGHNEYDLAKLQWTMLKPYPKITDSFFEGYLQTNSLHSNFMVRLDTIYRFSEITDFIKAGSLLNMKFEVQSAINELITLAA